MLAILIFAVYGALTVYDLTHRGFLSKLPVWAGTALLAPAAAALCAFSFFTDALSGLFSGEGFIRIAAALIEILAAIAAALMIITLYIRGHIKPVHKAAPEFSALNDGEISYKAAKRLIITGAIGTLIYLSASAVKFMHFITEAETVIWEGNLRDTLENIVVITVFLLIPFINIILAASLASVAANLGLAALLFAMALLESLFVTNGCIRLTVKTEYSSGTRALLIILSFIPVFNIIYGIYLLKKQSERINIY